MHMILYYRVAPDYIERRKPLRPAHFQHARASFDRGELMLAGALLEPVDGAVLVFRGDSLRVAEEFARADPYVRNGLVTEWRVRKWDTVLGDGLELPELG